MIEWGAEIAGVCCKELGTLIVARTSSEEKKASDF